MDSGFSPELKKHAQQDFFRSLFSRASRERDKSSAGLGHRMAAHLLQ
jgi:hypothetical protein